MEFDKEKLDLELSEKYMSLEKQIELLKTLLRLKTKSLEDLAKVTDKKTQENTRLISSLFSDIRELKKLLSKIYDYDAEDDTWVLKKKYTVGLAARIKRGV